MVDECLGCLQSPRHLWLLDAFPRTPPYPPKTRSRVLNHSWQRRDLLHVVSPGYAQQFGSWRRYARGDVRAAKLRGLCRIHRAGKEIGRCHPVGQGMMDLADERELLVGHTFGEVKLPQWVATVQRGTGDLPDDLVELSPPAGSRYFHSVQVIVKVNVAVLQPHRVMQPPRNVDKLVAQRIEQMQPV